MWKTSIVGFLLTGNIRRVDFINLLRVGPMISAVLRIFCSAVFKWIAVFYIPGKQASSVPTTAFLPFSIQSQFILLLLLQAFSLLSFRSTLYTMEENPIVSSKLLGNLENNHVPGAPWPNISQFLTLKILWSAIFCNTETLIAWSWSSKILKSSVGGHFVRG